MITKFKLFETNNSVDYLMNNLSEECLLNLGFIKSYTDCYYKKLNKDFNVLDTLTIHENKIFLNEFDNSKFLIDGDRAKTTKIYIDNYLEYYDNKPGEKSAYGVVLSSNLKKYSLLCFDGDKFIPKYEYAKKLEDKYEKNSTEYISELNNKSITKYKQSFDKVIELIRVLEGNEEDCIKSRKVSDFNL